MKLPPPEDKGLGPQLRPFEDAFSAITVIKEVWFPHLLTDKEKEQIAQRDGSGSHELA